MSADMYLESGNELVFDDPARVPALVDVPVVVGTAPPPVPTVFGRAVKRTIDVVGAAVALVIFAVPALLIAAVIKVTGGPVLFIHPRVGLDGRPIDVVKFRTMRVGAEREVQSDPDQRRAYEQNDFKLEASDPRITPIGRWLRRTSLDEIPQFINVLRGDMSLVGVRPLVRRELDRRPPYERACYVQFRPGITGLWQVEGRSTIGTVDRRRLDVTYVEEWTLRRDLTLLVKTPAAVARVGQTH